MGFHDPIIEFPDAIRGSGGGGGKGKGQSSYEAPNTLRSNARIRLVELLGEGPIVGLVDGAKSIYFDNTPLQNYDGTFNFGGAIHGGDEGTTEGSGVSFQTREGYPDQAHFTGIPMAETPFTVETRVRYSVAPLVRTISELNADAVRVVIRIPALASTDRETGNTLPADVSYAIDVRSSGGQWNNAVYQSINQQKATSPYVIQHRVELPVGGYPWEIRVRRMTPDSDKVELQNETWWESYTVVTEGKFVYPNSAMVALEINAREFGSSVPARTYDVKGLIVKVPSNYNPQTRAYSGIWNGNFKLAWTDNPAWVLYDLLTNNRYGLGEFIQEDRVDKWGLYTIAQYCDQLVPSGFRSAVTGLPIMEPRFTFNGVLNSRDEAYKVLQNITQAFRGMAYWSMGQVMAVADIPTDPVKLVSPANVIGGHFQYSGTAVKARHSVALVKWNDPQDFYRPGIELIQNDEMMQRFGWRQQEIQAIGCTSRGQAYRQGKWALDTEQHETEIVEYSCSWDQADLTPGQIILVADPRKANTQTGGRLKSVSGLDVVLDRGFKPLSASQYQLVVMLPDGKPHAAEISQFLNMQADGSYAHLRLATPLPQPPVPGAMWAISGTDVEPRRYRVLSIAEDEKNIFKVTALFHDPTKYARVEEDIFFDPPPYTRPNGLIRPPINLRAVESLYYQNGTARARITLSWTPSDDFQAVGYLVSAQTPQGFVSLGQTGQTSIDINDTHAGDYTFYVSSVSIAGTSSREAVLVFKALGWEGVDGPFVSHLEIFGRGSETTFGGRDPKFTWRNNFPGSSYEIGNEPNGAGTGNLNPYYRDNVVRVWSVDTNELLRTAIVSGGEWTYAYEMNVEDNARFGRGPRREFRVEVSVRDMLGRESKAAKLVATNPVPDLVIPNVRPGLESIFVDYPLSNDLDVAGGMIWLGETADFDPTIMAPAYDGINNFVNLKGEKFKTYYVRMAIYDAFGKDGLNISPAIAVTVDGFVIDATPPAIPTGLAMTPSVEVTATGETQTRLVAQWDESPSENFATFNVEIRQTGGNWVSFSTSSNRYEWVGLVMNQEYQVRVNAQSRNGYSSDYSETASVVMPRNSVPPGKPIALSALASLKSVFLRWTNPVDTDLKGIEIWSSTTDNRDGAAKIGTSLTTAFTHNGLVTGTTYYYWIRAVNTSDLVGEFNQVPGTSATPGQVAEGDIAANAVIAQHIRAGVIEGDHFNVTTSLPPTITIGTSGISMGALTDPAAIINAKTTRIDPGQIMISGDTTLASWRSGADITKINGGSVAANSLAANTLMIGLRGIDIDGMQFEAIAEENRITWTAGSVVWVNDAGVTTTTAVAAGEATWTTGTLYIAWQKAATTLTTSATLAAVTGADWVRVGSYRGTTQLITNFGRTLIDGDEIRTGSIKAQSLYSGELITDHAQIRSGLIQNVHLAGEITFDKMSGGTLSAADLIRIGGDLFTLNAAGQQLVVKDISQQTRVAIGKLATGPTDYGINIFAADGTLILGSGGFGPDVIPPSAISSLPKSKIEGLGTLAGLNTVSKDLVTGLGSFANISQINASNISTYIAGAAISNAYIANLHGDKILANTIGANQLVSSNLITNSAQINSAIIDTAHIKNLSVDNLKIANNAVSNTAAATGTGQDIPLPIYARAGARLVVIVTTEPTARFTGNSGTGLSLSYNGSVINTSGAANVLVSITPGPEGNDTYNYMYSPITMMTLVQLGYTGTHTFSARNPEFGLQGSGRVSIMAMEFSK